MIQRKIILETKNLFKAFYNPKPVTIFKDITFQMLEGESVAIVGRSGEGKSTLLHILGTLEEPCKGGVYIDGEKATPYNRVRLRNQKIGFVFQSFHLLEDYTALDNVLMPAKIGRKALGPGSIARERALYLLEKVGLADRAYFHTKLLSGGEKQRVALARAMCNDPCLIMADEPSGNLDRETAGLIHEILIDFAKTPGKGLILVTHDKELAALCSKQLELSGGMLS